jgi:hypothetical protein
LRVDFFNHEVDGFLGDFQFSNMVKDGGVRGFTGPEPGDMRAPGDFSSGFVFELIQ